MRVQCIVCRRGPSPAHGAVTVFKVTNDDGRKEWRCHDHVAPDRIDPETRRLVQIIEESDALS